MNARTKDKTTSCVYALKYAFRSAAANHGWLDTQWYAFSQPKPKKASNLIKSISIVGRFNAVPK
ncbi:hypothetical protein C7S14_4684 [Burkholderia cepacia]|nr:hypothetical protein C7S14_4684 [Burkholderia cepacia]